VSFSAPLRGARISLCCIPRVPYAPPWAILFASLREAERSSFDVTRPASHAARHERICCQVNMRLRTLAFKTVQGAWGLSTEGGVFPRAWGWGGRQWWTGELRRGWKVRAGQAGIDCGADAEHKTAELLRRIEIRRQYAKQDVLLLKPSADTKAASGLVESRNANGCGKMERWSFRIGRVVGVCRFWGAGAAHGQTD